MIKKSNSYVIAQWLSYVAFPLGIGALFYRLFRSRRPFILGDGATLELSQPIILQSVPSLLWAFALTAAMFLIWKPALKVGIVAVTGFVILISLLFEIWQAADSGKGTFDWNDCLFSVAGCLFSVLIFKRKYSNEIND